MPFILSRSHLHHVPVPPEASSDDLDLAILDLEFTETSGTAAVDSQALQNGLYVNSPDLGIPAMVSGGGGFGFKDFNTQYVSIAHNAAFQFASAFTFGVIYQPSALPTISPLRHGIVSKPSPSPVGHELSLELIVDAGTPKLRGYKSAAGGGAVFIGASSGFSQLQIGRADWIWMVSTATGTRIVHLGSEFFQSSPLLDGSLTSNPNPWGLGCYLSPPSGPLIMGNGCIGRFILFDFALTNTQIAAIEAAHPAQNTIWLRDKVLNVPELSGSIDLATSSHPENLTAVAGDNGAITTLGTPSGSTIPYTTTDISSDTADSVTAQVTDGILTSNEATIDLTVQALAEPSSTAPLVPLFTEWLPSDEAGETPDLYAKASASGTGSGTTEANAMSLSTALAALSAGQVLQYSCATPGTIEWADLPNGISLPSGTSTSNRTVIQAKNGDGLVISRGEDFADARTPDSGFWTQSGLSSDFINKKIWKSTGTFSGGQEDMAGWWIEFDHPCN